jgi:putative ABC transport system ATP-binding protein
MSAFTLQPQGLAAVRCRGVVKEFGAGDTRTRVLAGVDLDLAAGEITCLVGPSGCGKTTLISILAGLLTPEQGDVELFGTRLTRLRGGRLVDFRAEHLGFIFQQFALLPALTAAENAAVPLLVRGLAWARCIRLASQWLDRLGLGDCRSKLPSQLSGGQQQRVAIARALIHGPQLIVCDEPTAALDADAGRTVMQVLREVALEDNRVVLVVTHDSRIFRFADRILRMADGHVSEMDAAEHQENSR